MDHRYPPPLHLDVSAHDAGTHLGGVDAQSRGRKPQHDGRHLLPVAEELGDALSEGFSGELEPRQDSLSRVCGLLSLLPNPTQQTKTEQIYQKKKAKENARRQKV